MQIEGNILKMAVEHGEVVKYFLPVGEHLIYMNNLIGKRISLQFLNRINCIKCGRETRTSFAQGYCYPCFISAPETEECVLRPELCRAHEGIARDMDFAKRNCLIDHYVYLAVGSGLKVGVTRHTQIPARWIDQGASYAIKLAKTTNRYLAGILEVALKSVYNDKTNWRNMLLGKVPGIDLEMEKGRAEDYLPFDMREMICDDDRITRITYPVEKYPAKVKSINLEKQDSVAGVLSGIKGQYLIFESGEVINVRRHGGYLVRLRY